MALAKVEEFPSSLLEVEAEAEEDGPTGVGSFKARLAGVSGLALVPFLVDFETSTFSTSMISSSWSSSSFSLWTSWIVLFLKGRPC